MTTRESAGSGQGAVTCGGCGRTSHAGFRVPNTKISQRICEHNPRLGGAGPPPLPAACAIRLLQLRAYLLNAACSNRLQFELGHNVHSLQLLEQELACIRNLQGNHFLPRFAHLAPFLVPDHSAFVACIYGKFI